MARFLRKLPLYILIAINLLIVMAMIICAYAQYLPPQRFPNCSYFGMIFPLPLALNALFIIFWLIFKRKLVLLPLAGMLLCASAIRTFVPINFPKEIPEGSLKVLSYNVHSFGHANTRHWDENECVRYINECDADIACLQECVIARVDVALDLLKEKYPYQDLRNYKGNYLVLLSKYPILSTQHIDFKSKSNRSYAYEVLVDDDTIVVINNHLESYHLQPKDKKQYKELIKNPENDNTLTKFFSLARKLKKATAKRGPQADSVAAFIEKNKGRYIISCGDFNDASLSYTHNRLTENLNDAFTRSGCGFGISYHKSGMYFRIDNILCSPNITPYGAEVDNSISVSDHYPITAYLSLGER